MSPKTILQLALGRDRLTASPFLKALQLGAREYRRGPLFTSQGSDWKTHSFLRGGREEGEVHHTY